MRERRKGKFYVEPGYKIIMLMTVLISIQYAGSFWRRFILIELTLVGVLMLVLLVFFLA